MNPRSDTMRLVLKRYRATSAIRNPDARDPCCGTADSGGEVEWVALNGERRNGEWGNEAQHRGLPGIRLEPGGAAHAARWGCWPVWYRPRHDQPGQPGIPH